MNENIEGLHKKLVEILSDLDTFCKEYDIQWSLAYGSVLGAVRHSGFIPWDDDLDIYMTRDNYEKFLTLYKDNDKYCIQKENIHYPLQFSKFRANNTTFIEKIIYRKKYAKIHQGIYVDIFPVDKVSHNNFFAFLQMVFSNIIIAQSLFLRGYQTQNIMKKCVVFLSLLLFPFRKQMIKYVKSFNHEDNFSYWCSYYGESKKNYISKESFDNPLCEICFEKKMFPVIRNPEQYLTNQYGDYMKLPSEEEREYKIHASYFSIDEDYSHFLEKK